MAGGKGTRLYPLTLSTSKQLLPVYDKPMIFYPLTVLMLAGIDEIIIVTNEEFYHSFKTLFDDGRNLGLKINYVIQKQPNGIAEAFILCEEFIKNSPIALILGDNFFHGANLTFLLKQVNKDNHGATIFTYKVNNPKDYGVLKIDKNGKPTSIVEKPTSFVSNEAITGLYFYDSEALRYAKEISPSGRGELEISSINEKYLEKEQLKFYRLNRGIAWLDSGNFDTLYQASSYIKTLENRTGLKIGCPEEVAWRKKWITTSKLKTIAEELKKSGYGKYLMELSDESFK